MVMPTIRLHVFGRAHDCVTGKRSISRKAIIVVIWSSCQINAIEKGGKREQPIEFLW